MAYVESKVNKYFIVIAIIVMIHILYLLYVSQKLCNFRLELNILLTFITTKYVYY
jgi:hypothetical protein